jgi:hypothetical protein
MASPITVPIIAFVVLSVVLIGALLVWMRMRHRYQPNLIGVLVGALLCFLLLETLPALI